MPASQGDRACRLRISEGRVQARAPEGAVLGINSARTQGDWGGVRKLGPDDVFRAEMNDLQDAVRDIEARGSGVGSLRFRPYLAQDRLDRTRVSVGRSAEAESARPDMDDVSRTGNDTAQLDKSHASGRQRGRNGDGAG